MKRDANAVEAAEHYGISVGSARRFARLGYLPAYKLGPRQWRFDLDAPLSRPIPTSQRGDRPTTGRLRDA